MGLNSNWELSKVYIGCNLNSLHKNDNINSYIQAHIYNMKRKSQIISKQSHNLTYMTQVTWYVCRWYVIFADS